MMVIDYYFIWLYFGSKNFRRGTQKYKLGWIWRIKHTNVYRETTKLISQLKSLSNGYLSYKSLFYWDCGSFIFPCDVNVMLRMMCHYFSYSKWALFSWCAASCKSVIENSCKLKVQSNMVADRKRAASV